MPDPRQVRAMFARIAGRYDLLNRVLSGGVDRRWRRRLVEAAGPLRGRVALDCCCGTGDVARLLAREGARVLAVDFTAEMLALAARKPAVGPPHGPERHAVHYARADALHLPLFDRSADVATIAFGLRNLADRRAGLEELARVLRPGGRLLVLEFSLPPPGAIGALYRLYFTRVLPAVGGLVSGEREAYRYLPDTVLAWPSPGVLQREMEEVGLEACGYRLLLGGVACLSWGRARGGA